VPAVSEANRRPPHPSRNSPPSPLFEKERGDANNSFCYCSPSLIHLERGNKKGWVKLRIPHAIFHQLSLVAITLLNKDTFNRVNIKPLRGLAEFAFLWLPPSPFFWKRKGRCESCFIQLFPLLIHLERGNKKGVSKNFTPAKFSQKWKVKSFLPIKSLTH